MAFRVLIGGTISAPLYTFQDEIALTSTQETLALDLIGDELAADALDMELNYQVNAGMPDITTIPYGTVCWLVDGSTILCKMYIKQITQIGRSQYALEAMSAVGLLDKVQHLGGIYTAQTVAALLSELIGAAFPYSVSSDVAGQQVRGALEPGTARANLHKLMFAMGITLDKDANGDPVFMFLDPAASVQAIPGDRIYEAGRSVEFPEQATAVEVAEHSFYQLSANVVTEQLFDNTGSTPVTNQLVQFPGAYFELIASTGLTINASGPYYAVLTGVGTLTGKPYTHNTRTLRQSAVSPLGEEKIVTSERNTLVTALNAENVAKRMMAYYSSKRTVRSTVKLAGEKPGMLVSLADAFGTAAQGYISKSNVRIGSRIQKAELTIITDYTPTGQGNVYTTMYRFTASGTWTVPAGVTHIRVVVIGGGTGGGGGHNGIQFPDADLLFLGGDGLESRIDLHAVLLRQGVAQLGSNFQHGGDILLCGSKGDNSRRTEDDGEDKAK